MATQRPLRFSRGCWSLSVAPKVAADVQPSGFETKSGSVPGPKHPFVLSVPKRLLKQAVRRNLAKRIARETWRGFSASGIPDRLRSRSVMLRLAQQPTTSNEPSARAVKVVLRADCLAVLNQLEQYLKTRPHV